MERKKSSRLRSFRLSLRDEKFSYDYFMNQLQVMHQYIIIPIALLMVIIVFIKDTSIADIIYKLIFALFCIINTSPRILRKIMKIYGWDPDFLGNSLYLIPIFIILFMIFSGIIRPLF